MNKDFPRVPLRHDDEDDIETIAVPDVGQLWTQLYYGDSDEREILYWLILVEQVRARNTKLDGACWTFRAFRNDGHEIVLRLSQYDRRFQRVA